MPKGTFSGIIGEDKNITVGAWLVDRKAGRSRCLGVVTQNQAGVDNDQAYLGYFTDQMDPKGSGCNFSISLEEDAVRIQSVHPVTKVCSSVAIPADKFFDLLDALSVIDVAKVVADYTKLATK